jgi:hypothetical protein
MPSKDPINAKANAWLEEEGLVLASKPSAPTKARPRREMSPQILRLARRLDADPDELAKKIPADTLRRTKYPVIEIVNADGTRTFKHDLGINEGLVAQVRP